MLPLASTQFPLSNKAAVGTKQLAGLQQKIATHKTAARVDGISSSQQADTHLFEVNLTEARIAFQKIKDS